MKGTITKVVVGRGFGFIRPDDKSGDIFFHVRDLDRSLPFDEQLAERRVEFEVVNGGRGLKAINTRGV